MWMSGHLDVAARKVWASRIKSNSTMRYMATEVEKMRQTRC